MINCEHHCINELSTDTDRDTDRYKDTDTERDTNSHHLPASVSSLSCPWRGTRANSSLFCATINASSWMLSATCTVVSMLNLQCVDHMSHHTSCIFFTVLRCVVLYDTKFVCPSVYVIKGGQLCWALACSGSLQYFSHCLHM